MKKRTECQQYRPTADNLKEVVSRYKELFREEKGLISRRIEGSIDGSIKAVFRSWDNRAVYRRLNDIPGDWGTAVSVQEMVYGNR